MHLSQQRLQAQVGTRSMRPHALLHSTHVAYDRLCQVSTISGLRLTRQGQLRGLSVYMKSMRSVCCSRPIFGRASGKPLAEKRSPWYSHETTSDSDDRLSRDKNIRDSLWLHSLSIEMLTHHYKTDHSAVTWPLITFTIPCQSASVTSLSIPLASS